MLGFDAWSATFEEANAAQRLYSGSFADPEGPIYQWSAAQTLLRTRDSIVSGSGFDVLEAVASCAGVGLAMPGWLARVFLAKYRAVQRLQVASWDSPEAFGRPYPKNTNVAALRRRRDSRGRIGLLVTQFVQTNPNAPLDPHWEEWGREIGEGRTNTQKLYAQALKLGLCRSPSEIRLQLGHPKSPGKSIKDVGRRIRR